MTGKALDRRDVLIGTAAAGAMGLSSAAQAAYDPNAKFEELMELEKKFGKETLDDLGKRFEKLAQGDLKTCLKK